MFLKKSFLKINLIAVLCVLLSLSHENLYAQTNTPKHILVFGDSLSAAYGIDVSEGWVNLMEADLNQQTHSNEKSANKYKVSNASISGETTTGGLARLELTLQELKPDLVLLALGANDGLQGHPITKIESNINSMIDILEKKNIDVVVFGISIPATYGPRYIDKFRKIFPKIAQQRNLLFLDLYQEDFFLKPGFIQNDQLHPTAIAQPVIKDFILDFLHKMKLL